MSETEPEVASAAAPSERLRIGGFLCAALGGLLAGAATMLPWIRTTLQDLPSTLAPTYYGIDLPDGVVVLALAVVIVVAVLVARVGKSDRGRRGAAIVVVVASFIVIGVSGAAAVTASSRFEPTVVDDILEIVAPDGATPEQRTGVEDLVQTSLGIGPWLALGGGVLALIGGVMTLAWAGAQAPAPGAGTTEDPEPAS